MFSPGVPDRQHNPRCDVASIQHRWVRVTSLALTPSSSTSESVVVLSDQREASFVPTEAGQCEGRTVLYGDRDWRERGREVGVGCGQARKAAIWPHLKSTLKAMWPQFRSQGLLRSVPPI